MKRPLIGVAPLYDELRESYWMLPGYMQAVEQAGGLPVMMPLTDDKEVVHRLAHEFDGFLLTGGQDVSPELYGEMKTSLCDETCLLRDLMEKMLLEHVLKLDKAVFGICRGLQLINAVLGGTLYQDVTTQMESTVSVAHKQLPPYEKPAHSVVVKRETRLFDILRSEEIPVNSYHHQGICRLAPGLESVAYAPDGLIEAVVHRRHRFLLAVQWHPEFSWKSDSDSQKLFQVFVAACVKTKVGIKNR